MLGSTSDAEDAVQEAWLRLARSNADVIENLRGWLTTVVGRVCLDLLRARREEPSDSLPEPIVIETEGDPEHEALMAESVGLALLVVLETLSPAERLAFVLHDMFAVRFSEIAEILDRSPDSARQLASRARRRVRGARPVAEKDLARQREVVDAFLAASRCRSSPDGPLTPSRRAFASTRGGGSRRSPSARTRRAGERSPRTNVSCARRSSAIATGSCTRRRSGG